jgi:hypothetical protein
MTSNSNPHTAVIGECIKTFSVVTAMFPAGAQPGGTMAPLGRKRKLTDYQSSNTNSASTMPTVKEEKEDLAWVMCVLQMSTRQLALLNKTGQVNFEVDPVCRMIIDWIRNIIQTHFSSFFSTMLVLSYDRVIGGYLTRQVATNFMATCARHYACSDTVTDANVNILNDMESAPITLHACNLAICNAITHLVDTNVLMVNQIIKQHLNTPAVPMEFVYKVLLKDHGDKFAGGVNDTVGDSIFTWMSMVMTGSREVMLAEGYVCVPTLGSPEDYNSKEAFLESYFGVSKNSFYTYSTANKEATAKKFDFSVFFSMEVSFFFHFGLFCLQ